jgi:hypothetical protein
MKKLLIITTLILISISLSFSQTTKTVDNSKCTIKYKDFPLIRGVRLGMSKKQVLAVYPKLELEKPELNIFNESAAGWLEKDSINNPEYRKNLSSIYFSFYDDDLSAVSFHYDDSISWASAKEFTERITQSLKIPFESWKEGTPKNGNIESYMLSCDSFALITSLSKGNANLMITRSLEAWLDGNEKKIKEFKP